MLARTLKIRLFSVLLALTTTPLHSATTFLDHWRTVCDDFTQNYSYTEYKGINWDDVYETNKSRFENITSADEFAITLNDAFTVLHDRHVAVQKPDGTWIGYNRSYAVNYPDPFNTNHASAAYENFRGANAMIHARLTNDVEHLVIPTLDTAIFNRLTDSDLLAYFQSCANARGLIIDLRYNGGGNELHARRLASFFVPEPTLYGYIQTRTNAGPQGLSALSAKVLDSNPELMLSLPVVVLIGQGCLSSAEWFALMLRQAPNAVLLGDQTRGGSANPVTHSIPELGINYTVSTWLAYTPEKVVFEDRGIAPGIFLRSTFTYNLDGRDIALEHALDFMEWRYRTGLSQNINSKSDSDGDGMPDFDEFVAGSDPLNNKSVFNVTLTRNSPMGSGFVSLRTLPHRYYKLYPVESLGTFERPLFGFSDPPPVIFMDITGDHAAIYRVGVELAN